MTVSFGLTLITGQHQRRNPASRSSFLKDLWISVTAFLLPTSAKDIHWTSSYLQPPTDSWWKGWQRPFISAVGWTMIPIRLFQHMEFLTDRDSFSNTRHCREWCWYIKNLLLFVYNVQVAVYWLQHQSFYCGTPYYKSSVLLYFVTSQCGSPVSTVYGDSQSQVQEIYLLIETEAWQVHTVCIRCIDLQTNSHNSW